MEHMKPGLRFDKRGCCFGSMRRRLVHDHHQVPLAMVLQHLEKKVYDLLRSDPFIMESKDQAATTRDRGHGRHAATLPGNFLLRRLATRCPGFSQQRCEGNIRFVLKIQDRVVLSHGGTDLRQLCAHPCLPLLLRQLEVLSFGLLIRQARFMQPPHDGLFRQEHMELRLNDLNQSPRGPEVCLISVLGGRSQNNACQSIRVEMLDLPWASTYRSAQ